MLPFLKKEGNNLRTLLIPGRIAHLRRHMEYLREHNIEQVLRKARGNEDHGVVSQLETDKESELLTATWQPQTC